MRSDQLALDSLSNCKNLPMKTLGDRFRARAQKFDLNQNRLRTPVAFVRQF